MRENVPIRPPMTKSPTLEQTTTRQKWNTVVLAGEWSKAVVSQQCFAGPGRRPENHPRMCRGATSGLLLRASAWCDWAAAGLLCSWRLIACSGPMVAGGALAALRGTATRREASAMVGPIALPVHALVHNARTPACVQMCACKCVHVAPPHRPSCRSVPCGRNAHSLSEALFFNAEALFQCGSPHYCGRTHEGGPTITAGVDGVRGCLDYT